MTTETASGTGQMSQRSFPLIFLVKPLKAMTELHGGGDAHNKCGFEGKGRGLGVRPLH